VLKVCGDERSPIIHLRINDDKKSEEEKEHLLQNVVEKVREKGILVVRAAYIDKEKFKPEPSIRVLLSALHSEKDIIDAASALRAAFHNLN